MLRQEYYLFYAHRTVLPLAVFVDSPKQMTTNYMFGLVFQCKDI